MSYLIFVVVLVCGLGQFALAANKCYSCSTSVNPNCGDLSQRDGVNVCTRTGSDEIQCLKYVYRLNNLNITYRGCRRLDETCDNIIAALKTEGKEVVSCGMCKDDFCINGSTAIKTSLQIIIALLLVFIAL